MRERVFYVMLALLGGWLGWMYFDDQPPYTYVSGEIKPDPVRSEGEAQVTWHLTPTVRVCSGDVLRRMYNADETSPTFGKLVAAYDRTPASISVEVGDDTLIKNYYLPPELPRRVRYSADVCFYCNPLRRLLPICIRTPDLFFNVKN